FEVAAVSWLHALDCWTQGSDNFSGTLETLARIRLSQGRIDECDVILGKIEKYSSAGEINIRRYVYRHTLLTCARSLHQQGDISRAVRVLDQAIRSAIETHDELLLNSARVARARLYAVTCGPSELLPLFDSLT